MQYKIQNYELSQEVKELQTKIKALKEQKLQLTEESKAKNKELDTLEKKYNDAIIKVRELENKEQEYIRVVKSKDD